jgi:hypothetical protein
VAAERNLSAITFKCLEAIAYGRRVELVLDTGARIKGRPTRVIEDLGRKSACLSKGARGSHLLIALDLEPGGVSVERIREVKPTL